MNEIEKAIETAEKYCGYAGEIKEFAVVVLAALQEKQKRGKMCCENCKHEPRNPTSKTLPCSMCNIAYASYFEPKQEAAK